MKKKTKYISIVLAIIVISSGLVGIYLLVTFFDNETPVDSNQTLLGRYGPGTVFDTQLQEMIIFGGGTQNLAGYELFDDM